MLFLFEATNPELNPYTWKTNLGACNCIVALLQDTVIRHFASSNCFSARWCPLQGNTGDSSCPLRFVQNWTKYSYAEEILAQPNTLTPGNDN